MTENNFFEEKVTPTLTLGTDEPSAPSISLAEAKPAQPEPLVANLSPEEQQQVMEFSKKIDITDSNLVMQYATSSQQNIAKFSENALKSVRTKDLGEIGNEISSLVVELKGFTTDDDDNKGFFGLFKRTQNKVATLKARYDSAEVNIDKICDNLEDHQIVLLKDIALLDKMYDMNLNYFKELTMYILAGKYRLEQARNEELGALRQKAQTSGLTEDAQAANDFSAMCDRFEKKLHDLELTRTVSMQMAPQIRLIQNNDQLMTEKIQSVLVNTVPLWKSQILMALGLAHAQQAMEAQRAVTDLTNELLKKNADALKQGSVATAREAERGVVDIETLTHTNQTLIDTFDEVMTIQEEGRQKRHDAEIELRRIENELKNKLLEMRG